MRIKNIHIVVKLVECLAIKSGFIHLTKHIVKYKDQCLNKRMLDKSDLKGTLVYLLSDMSMYVNGQNIVVDDGFSL